MGWPQINFALEGLLLGGFALALALIFTRWLWQRLPWRRRRDYAAEYHQAARRKFEAGQLAELEADSATLWRPKAKADQG